jgi:hypothetical protein
VRGPGRRAQVQVQRGGRDPTISGMNLINAGSVSVFISSEISSDNFDL